MSTWWRDRARRDTFICEEEAEIAQGYDFCDLAFITTADGVIAIDAGTAGDRVKAALGDLDLPADGRISHLILTHAHWDHVGGADALRGPGTRVIAQAGFPAGLDRERDGRRRSVISPGRPGNSSSTSHPTSWSASRRR